MTAASISWEDFERVDIRVGRIVSARPNETARVPAYVLEVDLGPLGLKTSSAQITDHYDPEDLVGRLVLCVVNFEPKRIAGVKSEVLITGADDGDGIRLATIEGAPPLGSRLC